MGKEISEAKLKPNEDTELEEEQARLASYEKIYSDVDSIEQMLSNDESGVILNDQIFHYRKTAKHLHSGCKFVQFYKTERRISERA